MPDFETWKDLDRALLDKEKGTQTELARFMGMDPSQFSRMKKGKRPLTVMQSAQADEFFRRLKNGDLPRAEDHGRRPQTSRSIETGPDIAVGRRNRLPVYGHAAASDGDRFVLNEGEIIEERELPFGITLGPGEYFIVLPAGSSMEPRIYAGEPQVVRWRYPPARDRACIVEFNDGTAVIKNYRGYKDGRLFVEQFNPPKVLDFDATKVKAVHAVVIGL